MEEIDETTMSSGAWRRAEERARAQGRQLPRRGAIAAPGLQASLGLPNRIERLKRWEREVERQDRRLRAAWHEHAEAAPGDPAAFAQGWQERLRRWSFREANELADEHNEWFPIEAKLPWNRELGDFRAPFGLPWRKSHIGPEWALDRFPPDLAAAAADRARRATE